MPSYPERCRVRRYTSYSGTTRVRNDVDEVHWCRVDAIGVRDAGNLIVAFSQGGQLTGSSTLSKVDACTLAMRPPGPAMMRGVDNRIELLNRGGNIAYHQQSVDDGGDEAIVTAQRGVDE